MWVDLVVNVYKGKSKSIGAGEAGIDIVDHLGRDIIWITPRFVHFESSLSSARSSIHYPS